MTDLAETARFELAVPLRGLHLSRVVHSTGLCDISQYCLAHHSRMPWASNSDQPLYGWEQVYVAAD